MEEVRYSPDEIPFKLVFLKNLNDTLLDNKKAPLLIVGTITQILKSNENMCVFFIEDCTFAHIAEFFRNKLSPFLKVNKGDIVEIKAFYCNNRYGEKIIKVFKLRKITIDEEYLHYMDVLVHQKREEDNLFNEQRAIDAANKEASEIFIKVVPRDDILKRKVYSYTFLHFIKDWHLYKDMGGYISKNEIEDIGDVSIIKKKMEDEKKFTAMLDYVLAQLISSGVIVAYQSGYVINLNYFENFEANLLSKIRLQNTKQVSFRSIYTTFNDMIEENDDFNINKETVLEFLNTLITKKKLYFVDEKKEIFGIMC